MKIEFLSGFTGSYGKVLVTATDDILWVDGRYHIQAKQKLVSKEWTSKKMEEQGNMREVLNTNYDFIHLTTDLVEKVWNEIQPCRPKRTNNPVFEHPLIYSGQPWEEKIMRLRKAKFQADQKDVALIITSLEEIAWCLNLRGSDILYVPVFYAYLVLTDKTIYLFIDPKKLSNTVYESYKVLQKRQLIMY